MQKTKMCRIEDPILIPIFPGRKIKGPIGPISLTNEQLHKILNSFHPPKSIYAINPYDKNEKVLITSANYFKDNGELFPMEVKNYEPEVESGKPLSTVEEPVVETSEYNPVEITEDSIESTTIEETIVDTPVEDSIPEEAITVADDTIITKEEEKVESDTKTEEDIEVVEEKSNIIDTSVNSPAIDILRNSKPQNKQNGQKKSSKKKK